MTILAWVAGLVAATLLLDQLALWAERHGWLYWRKCKPEVDGGAITGMFGEIQTLLSPSNRHVVEEQRARRVTRLDAGTDQGIDLDAGTIRLPTRRKLDNAPRSGDITS